MNRKRAAEEAEHYNRTMDLSEFDLGREEPLVVRRNVTISVRFSEDEIAELRSRAETAGAKVTSYIRAAALEATRPVDRSAVAEVVTELEAKVKELSALLQSDSGPA